MNIKAVADAGGGRALEMVADGRRWCGVGKEERAWRGERGRDGCPPGEGLSNAG